MRSRVLSRRFSLLLWAALTCHYDVWAEAAIPAASATASHDLPTKYAVDKAIDGNPKTHWAANNKPPVWIRVEFAEPAQVDTLRILGVLQQRIYDNWRRVTVSFSDGSTFTATLADTWRWHTLTFPARETQWIKLTIESTYKRTHYVGCEEIEARLTGHGRATVGVEPKPKGPPAKASPAATEWQPTEADKRLLARLAPAAKERPEHPNLWVNSEDIERAKRHIRTRRWAFDYFRSILAQADQWPAKGDDEIRRLVPKPYAVFDSSTACPVCGKRLSAGFDRVGKGYCPKCKRAFPNEDYPDDGPGWKNPKTGKMHHFVGRYNDYAIWSFDRALRVLADAYALTREEKFARALSVLFDALAVIYPTCDKGPKTYPGVGGRLNRPFYQAARAMIGYADEYDLTYHSPEWSEPSVNPKHKTRRENFEENFLKNGGEYCYTRVLKAGVKSLNNGYCDYLQGALAVGRVLGVQRYIDYTLESEMSIFNFIENTIDRDGQYFETAFMYSSHAVNLFSHHAEMLRCYRSEKFPDGINLYDHPKMRLAFLRSERDIDCAGHVPPLGDTGPDLSVIRGERGRRFNRYVHQRLEYLAARAGDPADRTRYAGMLRSYVGNVDEARARSTITRWLTFNAADIPETAADKPASSAAGQNTLLPGARGLGILRSGSPTTGEVAALLRWGPTLNHGSPDELNLNFFALGREVTLDPGYLWAHMRAGWTHATGSHNLAVVNEANQLQQPGAGGDLALWAAAPGLSAMSANNLLCYGKQNLSRYQRTLLLADTSPTRHYLLDIFRIDGGHTHDLNWHFVGEMNRVHGLELPAPQAAGSLAGPQYEWWKLMQPSGWLKRVDKRFYWIAPPGNGYGFIHDLQRAPAPTRCAFDWQVGERVPMPRWPFEPAAQVADSSGKGHKPLSIGSFFYRGQEPGDFIEFSLPVDKAGEYLVLAVFYKSSHYGMVQASLDREPLGKPVNTFSPTGYFSDPIALGLRPLERGVHRLRFTVVGQDPESQGCYFSLRYFALDKPDFANRVRQRVPERVRLTLLPRPGTEIIVGRFRAVGTWPGATYVISRRKGATRGVAERLSTQFVSLVEPSVGEPVIAAIERCQPAGDMAANDIAALRIATHNGNIDYVFEAVQPVAAATYSFGPDESVRFAGRFGMARVTRGSVSQLVLHGNGELATGGKRLQVEDGEYAGTVREVDVASRAILTDAALPVDGSLSGCVIQFANPAYSRRSPFTIKRVVAAEPGTRVELDTASIVMARGLVGKSTVAPGVIPNLVPLDRERMVKRGFRTLYFQGKRVVSDDGRDWGRVKDVSVRNWHVTSTRPVRPKPGAWFSIVEIASGDSFTVIRTSASEF